MDGKDSRTCGNCYYFATKYVDEKGITISIHEKEPDAGICAMNSNKIQKVYPHFKCSNRKWRKLENEKTK